MSGSKKRKHRSKSRQRKNKAEEHRKPEEIFQKKARPVDQDNDPKQLPPQNISASMLKRQRGTAESTPLPPKWREQSKFGSFDKAFLTPQDEEAFTSLKKQCYRGFHWEAPEELPPLLHATFDDALWALDEAGLFLYDAVQPGRKRLSRTFVTRTLVGNPGTTYKYLGLRLFTHPWSVDGEGDKSKDPQTSLVKLGYSEACAQALLQVGRANAMLVERTRNALQDQVAPHVGGLVGSADFSLTLINKMEPTTVKKDLKREKLYGMGKTSVSWHKDSGLVDFSSIAVYHTLKDLDGDAPSEQDQVPWQVALRVTGTDNPTPALSVPLPSGALYYLLDDFNHKHEHTVLAGSQQLRFSSTHRVSREGRGTWQYIRDRCRDTLNKAFGEDQGAPLAARRARFVKATRAQQQLLTEIEFEWLRQWYIQGSQHARLHPYWHGPIKKIEDCFQELQEKTTETLRLLQKAAKDEAPHTTIVTDNVFDVMIEAQEERLTLQSTWNERESDPVFKSMPSDMQPISSPILKKNVALVSSACVADLRKWRKAFVKRTSSKSARSDLTKKEKRKIASNWESMKGQIR